MKSVTYENPLENCEVVLNTHHINNWSHCHRHCYIKLLTVVRQCILHQSQLNIDDGITTVANSHRREIVFTILTRLAKIVSFFHTQLSNPDLEDRDSLHDFDTSDDDYILFDNYRTRISKAEIFESRPGKPRVF